MINSKQGKILLIVLIVILNLIIISSIATAEGQEQFPDYDVLYIARDCDGGNCGADLEEWGGHGIGYDDGDCSSGVEWPGTFIGDICWFYAKEPDGGFNGGDDCASAGVRSFGILNNKATAIDQYVGCDSRWDCSTDGMGVIQNTDPGAFFGRDRYSCYQNQWEICQPENAGKYIKEENKYLICSADGTWKYSDDETETYCFDQKGVCTSETIEGAITLQEGQATCEIAFPGQNTECKVVPTQESCEASGEYDWLFGAEEGAEYCCGWGSNEGAEIELNGETSICTNQIGNKYEWTSTQQQVHLQCTPGDWNLDVFTTDYSSINDGLGGFDGCCGDLGEETQDIGYIDTTKIYGCFDNYEDGRVSTPGNEYRWYRADETGLTNYQIFQGQNTQYISNGNEWYQCQAVGNTNSNANIMNEYGKFNQITSQGQEKCSNRLSTVVQQIDSQNRAGDCPYTNAADCDTWANNNQLEGYCYTATGEQPIYEIGNFEQQCTLTIGTTEICRVKPQNQFISLSTYLNQIDPVALQNLCSIIPFEDLCNEFTYGGNPGTGGLQNQENCNLNPALCLGENTNADNTCAEIYEETYGNSYLFVQEEKVCTTNSYCQAGELIFSTEDGNNNPQRQCCYGETAKCEDYTDDICTQIGGTLKTNNEQTCIGQTIGQEQQCCIGYWSLPEENILQNYNAQNAFICYNQQGNNLIQECCGIGGCYNINNPLNNLQNLIPSGLTATAGQSLHSIITFDTPTEKKVLIYEGDIDNPLENELSNRLLLRDWTGYETLEFDIAYLRGNIDSLILILTDGSTVQYDLKENIIGKPARNKKMHVSIELGNQLQTKQIQDIQITFTQADTILLDNFYLGEKDGNENSLNYYCSGDWGEWVENLDGPTDEGFYGEEVELDQYGK